MAPHTGISPTKRKDQRLAGNAHAGRKGTGSLTVHLLKGKDAALILDLDKDCTCRKEGHVFIVFAKTARGPSPVAYCCITDDIEVNRGMAFESNSCFDSQTLIARYPDKRFLEISTFHILDEDKAHRARGLLWRAVTGYCERNRIDYVLGCFSFDGKYPAAYAVELSYLYHYCQVGPELQVSASSGVSMDIMPAEAVRPDKALRFLPPLLRYCLRLGAKVSNMVAVDKNLDAMNVFLLMPARATPAPAF